MAPKLPSLGLANALAPAGHDGLVFTVRAEESGCRLNASAEIAMPDHKFRSQNRVQLAGAEVGRSVRVRFSNRSSTSRSGRLP